LRKSGDSPLTQKSHHDLTGLRAAAATTRAVNETQNVHHYHNFNHPKSSEIVGDLAAKVNFLVQERICLIDALMGRV
jgi:hypothetical protein